MADTPKSWLEIVLLPIVIAGVGVFSTQLITHAQLESAERIARANTDSADSRAKSEQQIKVLEIFSDQIKSENISKRMVAVRMLGALDSQLGEKLARAVADSDPAPEVKRIAEAVVTAGGEKGNSFAVVGSYRTLQEAQNAATRLGSKLTASTYTPEIYLAENNYYALTFGGYLSSAEARRRVQSIKSAVPDAYVRVSDRWGVNLLR
jgi:hypothetical protein